LVEVVFFGWLIIVLYLLEFKLLGVGDWMVYFVVWYCCEVDFDCFVDGWCVLLYFGEFVYDYDGFVWVIEFFFVFKKDGILFFVSILFDV